MASALKCDNCGALYESYPEVMPVEDSRFHAVTLNAIEGKGNLDLCVSCKKWLAGKLVHYYSSLIEVNK